MGVTGREAEHMSNNDPIDRSRELLNCSFVKTVLMFVIILFHCITFLNDARLTDNCTYDMTILDFLSLWMDSFDTRAFFLVSGYIFYYIRYERNSDKGYSSYKSFMKKKFSRLVVPYIFTAVFWVIPFSVYYFHCNLYGIFINIVLMDNPQQLWFLITLFNIFAVFYLLSDWFKDNNISGAILILIFYIIYILSNFGDIEYYQISHMLGNISLFYVGFKIRQYGSDIFYKIPAFALILLNLFLVVVFQRISYNYKLAYWCYFILNIVGGITAFVVLQKIANKVNWENNKCFLFLSKRSMPVYLFHQQIVYVFIAQLGNNINPYLKVIITFAGAAALSLIISSIMLKFKVTRFLIGEK